MTGPRIGSPGLPASTIVIGLGNTTLTDDAAGPRAARMVRDRLVRERSAGTGGADVQVVELATGGLALMEAMAGYDVAVVLDALRTGRVPVGTVVELDLTALEGSLHQGSVHDMSLPAALEVGRAAGVRLPARIHVLGVEVHDVTTFGDHLTPEVEAALPQLVQETLGLLPARTDVTIGERNLTPLERTSCA